MHVLSAESEHGKAPRVCVNRTTAFASWHGVNGRRWRGRRSVVEARARAVLIIALARLRHPSAGAVQLSAAPSHRPKAAARPPRKETGKAKSQRSAAWAWPSIMHACLLLRAALSSSKELIAHDKIPLFYPWRGVAWQGVM